MNMRRWWLRSWKTKCSMARPFVWTGPYACSHAEGGAAHTMLTLLRGFSRRSQLRFAVMNHRSGALAAIVAAPAATVFTLACAAAEAPAQPSPDPAVAATMARVRDAAMASDWSWQRLEELTD